MWPPTPARWQRTGGAAPDLPPRLRNFLDAPLLVVVQAGVLLALAGVVATKYWQDHIWFGWFMLAVAALAWAPELLAARARRWWFVYVAGIFAYTLLRSYADETGMPIQVRYPVNVDHWLFTGNDPTVSLQARFFEPDRVTALDWLAVLTHWSFFIAPHALAVAVFVWRRELFVRYVAVVVGTMYAGLLLFFLVPTAPPWIASEEGVLPVVYRVMDYVGGSVSPRAYGNFYTSLGEPNSVAAMPSIHMGVTFAMALWAWPVARRFAWGLLAYTGVMGMALVYLGEHYVVDLAAGMACALVAYTLAWWATRHAGTAVEAASASGQAAVAWRG